MKFAPNFTRHGKEERGWPGYLFGGRVRTSTVVLIVAFLGVWWVYDAHRPEPAPEPQAPAVVPPGYVPDPDYTWVPRTRVQPPSTVRSTPTPSPTETTTPPPPFPPPIVLPPPFGPGTTSPTSPPGGPPGGPTSQLPQPTPGPVPTSPPPPR